MATLLTDPLNITIPLSQTTLATAFMAMMAMMYLLWLYHAQFTLDLFNCRKSSCPPYPQTSLFGSDFEIAEQQSMTAGTRRAFQASNFSRLGKTFETNHWGHSHFHTCDPRNIQAVLAFDSDSFGVAPSRLPRAGPWLGRGVFIVDGAEHARARALLKPIFNKAHVKELPRLERHLSKVVEGLKKEEWVVDLQAIFARMYLDNSTSLLFGTSTNTLDPDNPSLDASQFISDFNAALIQVAQARQPWIIRCLKGDTADWGKPFESSQAFVDKHVDAAFERHRRGEKLSDINNGEFVFLNALVAEGITDRRVLRDQLLSVFFPARDSSGIGIGLVMFQHARHLRVWARIREEVCTVQGGLTYETLKRLPYLTAVVNEALRLQAPASQAQRTALRTTTLPFGGGPSGTSPVHVAKGDEVTVYWHPLHTDPAIWGPDANEFRPERWLEGYGMREQRKGWEYIPFMGGPRIYPAQGMVLAQYAYVVARLAGEFRGLGCADGGRELVEEYRTTMQSKKGVLVCVIK